MDKYFEEEINGYIESVMFECNISRNKAINFLFDILDRYYNSEYFNYEEVEE